MFALLIRNHVLTNLTFLLVVVLGAIAYLQLPREQDPSVNFNWVTVRVIWPGASAEDVETRVTEPLEEGIERVDDTKFVSSNSRQGIASILVRFEDIGPAAFDKRMDDLRREIQSQLRELPADARQPEIVEVSSANAFPTATLALVGRAADEQLRRSAVQVRKDLQRMSGVDRVESIGQTDPELQVDFSPEHLVGLGVSPVDLADTVTAYFRDLAAGSISLGDQQWFVRVVGTSDDPRYLEDLPIVTALGELPLRSVAEIVRGHDEPDELVRYGGHPAVLLSVFKADQVNNIELLARIRDYMDGANAGFATLGLELVLLEDQTLATQHAVRVMERNALVGLALVLVMVWLFLGLRVAVLTSIGIPFVLGGVFILLALFGQTLNSTTLLAVVISLGMLVDDAVVVVEAIYYKLREGYEGVAAAVAGLQEVAVPVGSAVLTTIAAFLPLMLIPGVLGDYMKFVPAVVTLALLISLVEAYWMLPSHMLEARVDPAHPGKVQRARLRATDWLRRRFARALVRFLGLRWWIAPLGAVLLGGAVAMVAGGLVRVDYFATDLYRLFYINVEMPPGTKVEKTLATLETIEQRVRAELREGEARALISYAGQRFTETEPMFGEEKGQVFVSLEPAAPGRRGVEALISAVRAAVEAVPGPLEVSFLRRKIGPPTLKAINVKVRGDDVAELRAASAEIKRFLAATPGVVDISDDDTRGRMELEVRLDPDAIVRAGLSPAEVVRMVRLYADGEVVASMQHQGERLEVRVRGAPRALLDTRSFLDHPVGLPDGSEIALGKLLRVETQRTTSNIRHYDFRRAITVEADIDSTRTDTVSANLAIRAFWAETRDRYPGVDIDLTGQNDDIEESLNAILVLFVVGLGLIYLILGAQFVSYRQPLLVLATVPMAFIGVVVGLFASANPLSLYTLYGVVALAGIAANDCIVLISTANRYLANGLGVARAVVAAARRRVVPIIITSLTTIAGLVSLATGLAGESLMWGPVATAIVWGLGFSTLLTLFFIPALYLVFTRPPPSPLQRLALLPLLVEGEPGPWARWSERLGGGARRARVAAARIPDLEWRERYRAAVAAVDAGELEPAIRELQWLADQAPESTLFASALVQALLLYLHRLGGDAGYVERARRYLARARRLDPQARHLLELERVLRGFETESAA
ncbi:efflux RND transporter permease subunit [Marichromatium sp. PS1]|uniref:efflux RND transporter permease subunit n=1 Tax=Marichromatium sp. PS1 TaxID=3138932 RepID=UPI0032E5DE49